MFGIPIEVRNGGLQNEGQKCYSLIQSGRYLNQMLYQGNHKVSSVFSRPVDLVAKWISVTYSFMYISLTFQLASRTAASCQQHDHFWLAVSLWVQLQYTGYLWPLRDQVTQCRFYAQPVNWQYSHASLNDGDTSWEMRRSAISSLCERHSVLTQT